MIASDKRGRGAPEGENSEESKSSKDRSQHGSRFGGKVFFPPKTNRYSVENGLVYLANVDFPISKQASSFLLRPFTLQPHFRERISPGATSADAKQWYR